MQASLRASIRKLNQDGKLQAGCQQQLDLKSWAPALSPSTFCVLTMAASPFGSDRLLKALFPALSGCNANLAHQLSLRERRRGTSFVRNCIHAQVLQRSAFLEFQPSLLRLRAWQFLGFSA